MEKTEVMKLLCEVSTNFLVELTPEETLQYFRISYLSDLIQEINCLIPKMDFGPENPNTGRFHHKYMVGREGRTVVYLKIVKAEQYMDPKFDYLDLAKKLEKLSSKYQAEEKGISRNDEIYFMYRMWF